MVEDIKEIKSCPACGSDNLTYVPSKDQVICKDCGIVHEPFSTVVEEVLEVTHPIKSEFETATEKVTVMSVKKKPKAKKRQVQKVKKSKSKKKAKKAKGKVKKTKKTKPQKRKAKTKNKRTKSNPRKSVSLFYR